MIREDYTVGVKNIHEVELGAYLIRRYSFEIITHQGEIIGFMNLFYRVINRWMLTYLFFFVGREGKSTDL